MLREIIVDGGEPSELKVTRKAGGALLDVGGSSVHAALDGTNGRAVVRVDGLSTSISYIVDRDTVLIHAFGRTWRAVMVDPDERALLAGNQSDVAKAPMPGVTIEVLVASGDEVAAGQTLLIIESMKMQMEIKSSRAGTIDHIAARAGESFALGATLVTLAPLDETEG